MGGIWERAIRSVRAIFSGILLEYSRVLTDEMLSTFMCEAESIVNCRPITVESLTDPDINVLTPNHLLTMKPRSISAPPGEFVRQDEYSRKRWRTVQLLADRFWSRWKSEYVTSLQKRQRWLKRERNFVVGDVVLIKTEMARNQWPIGRVTEAILSKDGLVRSVEVKSPFYKDTVVRPVTKLVLLVEGSESHGGGSVTGVDPSD